MAVDSTSAEAVVANLLTGAVTDFIDELVGVFTLIRSQLKQKVSSFALKMNVLNANAGTNYMKLTLDGKEDEDGKKKGGIAFWEPLTKAAENTLRQDLANPWKTELTVVLFVFRKVTNSAKPPL